jgi:hypothetical protein
MSEPPFQEYEAYAYLSNIAYLPKKQWKAELSKAGFDPRSGWHIDSLSTKNTMILGHHPSKKVIFVGRGTSLDQDPAEDLFSDAFVSANITTISPRYKQSKKLLQKTMEKYKDWDFSVTGHSLAGTIALELGREFNLPSHSFNPGISPLVAFHQDPEALKKRLTEENAESKQKVHIVPGDWISNSGFFLGPKDHVIVHEAKHGDNPHTVKNFTPNIAIE